MCFYCRAGACSRPVSATELVRYAAGASPCPTLCSDKRFLLTIWHLNCNVYYDSFDYSADTIEKKKRRYILKRTVFLSSGIRIRTRTEWVRVTSATLTQSRYMVRIARLELARFYPHAPQTCASADSAISAFYIVLRSWPQQRILL